MLDVDRKKNYQLFFDFSCDSIAFLFLFLHFDYIEAEVRGNRRFPRDDKTAARSRIS